MSNVSFMHGNEAAAEGAIAAGCRFYAGYPIVERRNHDFYISHYAMGMDATVNWGGPDFRFRNDTKHGILIRTAYTDATMTVALSVALRVSMAVEPLFVAFRNRNKPATYVQVAIWFCNCLLSVTAQKSSRRMGTGVPAGASGVLGGRTIRQCDSRKVRCIEESCRAQGVAVRVPSWATVRVART